MDGRAAFAEGRSDSGSFDRGRRLRVLRRGASIHGLRRYLLSPGNYCTSCGAVQILILSGCKGAVRRLAGSPDCAHNSVVGVADPQQAYRDLRGKVTTMKKIGEITTSIAVVARIAIIAAAGTGLAAVATGVAGAVTESDRAIKREIVPVVWDR